MPTNDTDAWLFALVYSPNSQLPFPVPGLAYQMVASEQWQFSLGIPFSATYKPTPRWKFEVSYLPVVLVNARATWQFAESTSLYGGFGTNIDGYFLTDRAERRDQFYSFGPSADVRSATQFSAVAFRWMSPPLHLPSFFLRGAGLQRSGQESAGCGGRGVPDGAVAEAVLSGKGAAFVIANIDLRRQAVQR